MARNSTNASFGSCFHSRYGDPSLEIRVIAGVLLSLFFVTGCISNVKVIHVFRGKATQLKRSTAWILRNLAVVDLIACLVNIPIYFVPVVIKPQESILSLFSNATMALTQATSWGNFLCFIFLSIDRSDAIIRLNASQRITLRRLRLLIPLMWFSAAMVSAGFLYFQSSSLCLVLWRHKTISVINPVDICVFLLGFSTIIYVAKSCYVFRRSIITLAFPQKQREDKITGAIMMNIFFFLATYLPHVISKVGHCILFLFFNIDLSMVNPLVVTRTLMFLGHVMNPFIYARISPTFIKVSSVAFWTKATFSRVDPVIRNTRVQNKGETHGKENMLQVEGITSDAKETKYAISKEDSNRPQNGCSPSSSKPRRGGVEESYFMAETPSILKDEYMTEQDASAPCQSEEQSDDRSEEMNGQPFVICVFVKESCDKQGHQYGAN